MPTKRVTEKAKKDLRAGKAPTTAAGEFVREEIEHVRQGKHGARSPKQAIAIGLSKARRAGVPLQPPKAGSRTLQQSAERDLQTGEGTRTPRAPSRRRGRAVASTLKNEPKDTTSTKALSKQTRGAARRKARSAQPAARQ